MSQEFLQIAKLEAPAVPAPHPLDPALAIAQSSYDHVCSNVNDYTALFVKRCRVGGEMPPLQYAKLKIRTRKVNQDDGSLVTPLSVYLDFLKPSSVQGREVIWVENANDGNLVVHQGGFASFLTTRLDPEGMLAMRGQRYSIKQIGIENLLRQIIQTGQSDRRFGECEVAIRDDVKFGPSNCTVLEITHPVKREHFRFHLARVYFDKELNVPIRYQAWTWPETPGGAPVLDEEYNYFKIQVNVGLSDSDFDETNPEYRFN